MNVEQARILLGQLETVDNMLQSAANEATRAEDGWQEYGDGTVVTLWTAAHKQAFVDIQAHTQTIIAALLAREVATE